MTTYIYIGHQISSLIGFSLLINLSVMEQWYSIARRGDLLNNGTELSGGKE